MFTAQQALQKAQSAIHGTEFRGTASELPDKYVFELVPKGSTGSPIDCLYSVDKKTGKVETFSPLSEDYSFASASPIQM